MRPPLLGAPGVRLFLVDLRDAGKERIAIRIPDDVRVGDGREVARPRGLHLDVITGLQRGALPPAAHQGHRAGQLEIPRHDFAFSSTTSTYRRACGLRQSSWVTLPSTSTTSLESNSDCEWCAHAGGTSASVAAISNRDIRMTCLTCTAVRPARCPGRSPPASGCPPEWPS